ncbi:hypothetical protein GHT06_010491 [Daphnia sinensis]|uniref:NADH dehydrogenase [ubiquinone] 1 alpha subcomplex subunit 11 n=1 Tax=Daphnia sinensis TaxID=1820382 RepID=A0AAD5L0K1_9CRUS|nr:hypothetical protein GHT06_010491 [Daphnia sinensis]
MQALMNYKYYDSPEGQDCFQKMFYMSKHAAYFGLGIAATDVLLISHPKGYVQTAGRFVHYMGPLTAMAAAFAATTCIATSLRGKDDRLNYVIGAASSAAIFGTWKNSLSGGLHAFLLFGVVAYMKKKSVEEGWEFFPTVKKQKNFLNSLEYDFSSLKDKFK